MERTASRPPPGGGANWAVFFAPLAVTGVVILGALIFVWSSEPEPVERPEVERVDLSEVAPIQEPPRLSSVPTAPQVDMARDDEPLSAGRALKPRPLERESVSTAPSPEATPGADLEDDYDDDEDFVDMTSDREYTPEERREAKAGLMDSVRKVPFMAPMMKNLEPKEAASEALAESATQEVVPTNQEVPAEPAQSGAAGAATQ